MGNIIKWGAISSSLLGIALGLLFIFYNPYNEIEVSSTTKGIIVFKLMLPSALMIISLIFDKTILMILSFVWLVPYTIYMAVASIPSIWNLFFIFLLFQFLSILVQFAKRKSQQLPK